MLIKPIGDRILIEKKEAEAKTASGIVLPTSAQEQPSLATVIEISYEILNDGKRNNIVKKGDTVIFSKYSGTEVKSDSKEYLIVKWADILAVVK